ncbi:MAG: helix-turn-helix transcriptional regulator [Clostridia bacterium]|nr:helix-turn-helix transcriptional regulator [Clostridia bacterium]
MVDYEKMGKRMKYKRQAKNMNQEDIAKKVQISPSYYGNIERGSRVPSVDTLVAIANALDVGTDFLLADSLTAANPQRIAQETQLLTRFLRDRVEELNYGDALDAEDAPPEP